VDLGALPREAWPGPFSADRQMSKASNEHMFLRNPILVVFIDCAENIASKNEVGFWEHTAVVLRVDLMRSFWSWGDPMPRSYWRRKSATQSCKFDIIICVSQLLMHPPRHGVGLRSISQGRCVLVLRFVDTCNAPTRSTEQAPLISLHSNVRLLPQSQPAHSCNGLEPPLV
jgi:hypothetical protein